MKIDGKSKIFGLIGNPVEHTKSPDIHNTLAQLTQTNLCYIPLLVTKDKLAQAIEGAYALNIQGLNITIPYKTEVIPYLCSISEEAKSVGAVNTLKRVDGGYEGYNTDITGLMRALKSDRIDMKDKKCLIIGAGGAARAAISAVVMMDAAQVTIINRTFGHAEKLAENMNQSLKTDICSAMTIEQFLECKESGFLCIHTTKLGLPPRVDEVFTKDKKFFDKIIVGYDIIPTNQETGFMKMCNEYHIPSYNGLKMLLYQAIDAYEIWNDTKVSNEIINDIYQQIGQ